LRTFEAAARLGSYTRAAEELHVTHSAVSHQIRALEEQLGFALFSRQGRAVVLTPAGEELAASANTALRQMAETIGDLRRRSDSRRLSISVMPSFAGRWLAPRIAAFIDANPDCEVNILSSTERVDFAREAVDVAIRWGPGGYTGVRVEHLMDDVLFPVISPAFPGRVPQTPADLAGLPLLRSDLEFWTPWFRRAGLDLPEPGTGLLLSDSGLLVRATIKGQGVALARRSLVSLALRRGKLLRPFAADLEVPYHSPSAATLPDSDPSLPRWRYWLVLPQRRVETPLLQRFLDWVREEAVRDWVEPLDRRAEPAE
jgi:LysR family glycine cleavage system transcriptional activator